MVDNKSNLIVNLDKKEISLQVIDRAVTDTNLSSQSSHRMPTPIKPERLQWYLRGYSPKLSEYLFKGFSEGFRLHNFKFYPIDSDKTLKSASSRPEIVDKKLQKELQSNRLLGPFKQSPFKTHVISPLGLVPKKDPGEFRVIHHLSYPSGKSINDGIPREFATVHYTTISDAIKHIVSFGNDCYLAKSDIKAAFRIIPIHPMDYHLLGMKWHGLYYFDKCLPMGASSSCSIFERFSTFLEWIIQQKIGNAKVIHVLDDFLFIARSEFECQRALDIFLKVMSDIGVPIAPEKTFKPTKYIQFLGVDLDTQNMLACLPEEKVKKFSDLIDEFLGVKSVTLKKMQSLTGMLNFSCGVISPGRAFSRRLYNLTIGVQKPYYHIKLSKDVKEDLRVWKRFLHQYNRKTFFLEKIWNDNLTLKLYTDASTTIGFGAMFGNSWFYGNWEDQCKGLHISILELYPICVALDIWGPVLANKCIHLFCDNIAVVFIVNKFTSKDPYLMKLVRYLVFTCMKFNILIKATHLCGRLNTIADKLSRGQVQQARAEAPYLEAEPTRVPPELMLHKLLGI